MSSGLADSCVRICLGEGGSKVLGRSRKELSKAAPQALCLASKPQEGSLELDSPAYQTESDMMMGKLQHIVARYTL